MIRLPALALLVASLLVVGCGEPDPPSPPGVGDTQSLQGEAGSARVELEEIVDPLEASQLSRAEPGRRLVAVKLKVTNLGKKTLKFVPSADSVLLTNQGKAPATIAANAPCSEQRQIESSIPAGRTETVCAVFQPKLSAKLSALEVALVGGAGSGRQTWQINEKAS